MLSCFVAQVATSHTSSTAQAQVRTDFPIYVPTDGVGVASGIVLKSEVL